MATVKKGILVRAGEMWKHLRWTKRAFWKRQRQAKKRLAKADVERGVDRRKLLTGAAAAVVVGPTAVVEIATMKATVPLEPALEVKCDT